MWGTSLFTRAGCIATATFDLPKRRPTPPHLASISQYQRVSTRRSAENHETTSIPLRYPGHSLTGPSASHPPPLVHSSHQRRQPGGIPPHNGRAGKICRCGTPVRPHGDHGPKNRTLAPETNASADEKTAWSSCAAPGARARSKSCRSL